MKFLKVFGLVLVVALLAASAASAQDDEPSGITLPILQDGDTFEGTFEGTITGQLLAFNGSEGDEVTISMVQADDNSTLDPYIVLLGQEGQVLAYDDDSGEQSLSSLIEDFELPYDGSYYILATTFSNLRADDELDDALEYELTLSGNTQPEDLEGYDAESASFLRAVVEIGESGDGELAATEPVFYFIFEGEEGQTIDVTLESEDFDPMLYLFGPDGVRLGVNDDADGLNSAIEGVELPATDTYLLFVTSYGFDRAAEGDFDAEGNFTLSIEESN